MLPKGGVHSTGEARSAKDRVRTSWQLIKEFFRLLHPYRWQITLTLLSVTLSTGLGLLPPAGTKFIVDYVLGGLPLPTWFGQTFPSLNTPMRLLSGVVGAVVVVSLLKIAIHIWGRWDATRISKQIQLAVRRRVFEHAVRLPLHRIHELRSGGVASVLREDGGSVGELVFGMLYNPWRAVIQLVGSFVILAWVDWTLLAG
ncbi:MAG: ABC transporter ATP-binding protein, partial [Planctomycetaceae bacterium]